MRTRAQKFEIITGGDPSADQEPLPAGLNPDDEGQAARRSLVPLAPAICGAYASS